MSVTAIVLAAGQGTRMKSKHPKVTHKILDTPLVLWPLIAARDAGVSDVVVVVGHGAEEVEEILKDSDVKVAIQKEQKGTGHAVQECIKEIDINSDYTLILYGDTPLITPDTIKKLIEVIKESGASEAVLTMAPKNPSGYGRILYKKNTDIAAIIEDKDCTELQRENLTDCNSGIVIFKTSDLKEHISEIKSNNAQGEFYITDMVQILNEHEKRSVPCSADDYSELLGVNSRVQLAEASKIMQKRINEKLMNEGVTMIDPDLVWVSPNVKIGNDIIIYPLTFIEGESSIGSDCVIGPNTRLHNTKVGNGSVVDETVAEDVIIENNVNCGPRAYLRPGTHMLDGSKAGTHVEIKKSTIGKGSKVPHLSYIGDTTMGEGVNVGAGSITCNYDGYSKSPTTIGDNVFIGSNTMMVAPVNIGDGAMTAAASCIVSDVDKDDMAVARNRQSNIKGYAAKRRAQKESE